MSLSQSENSYEGTTVDVDDEEEEAEGFSYTFCCNFRISIIRSVCSCHACGRVIQGGPLHWLRRHHCNSCTSAVQSTDQNDQEREEPQGPQVEVEAEQSIPSISVTQPANEE